MTLVDAQEGTGPPDGDGGPDTAGTATTPAVKRNDETSVALLKVPEIPHDADLLTAGLDYAKAGIYVVPVEHPTKNPGSLVGANWQTKSSRDPHQIVAWLAGTDHDIALHCGRSGLVVFDVDHPDKVPDVLARHLGSAPYQSTRLDDSRRGHYVFAMPPGRSLGNGTGGLGGAWGEVRGLNGVIIVAPSRHANDGEYRWMRTGPVPMLPDDIAELLDDASPAEDAATDEQVTAFLAEHTGATRPEIMAAWTKILGEQFECGSRHNGAVRVTVGALKEARAGYLAAQAVVGTLEPMFVIAATRAPTGDERQRTERQARDEYAGIVSWAVAQANAADLDEVRRRTEEKMPSNVVKIAPGSLNGAALLDAIDGYLGQHVIYPSTNMRHAHALWIAHTHLMDCWVSTPRMAFLSPEPASGKTRALEVTEPLVPNPVHAVNTTSAYLFRKVSDPAGLPTILYDEIDTVFGPKAKDNEDIRGMLNAGHRNGAVAGRCVVRGKIIETEELPAYCAVAVAGLNDLPDTIMSRSIVSRMRKRAPSESVNPWRYRTHAPAAEKLRVRLASWADGVRDEARTHLPDMPESVTDRRADAWEPLLAVADLAGGHWPETARDAAVADVADAWGEAPSLGVMLLQDIRAIFLKHDEHGETGHLMTASLLTDLRGVEEAPWASIKRDGNGIDARGLAQRLAAYGIKSCDIRDYDTKTRKGYFRAAFTDAWARYLPPPPPPDESATSATAATPLAAAPPILGERCTVCLEHPLWAPESVRRGICEPCWQNAKSNNA